MNVIYDPVKDKSYTPKEWEQLSREVFKRDDDTCCRCDKKMRAQRELVCYGIEMGGDSDASGFVTLCVSCSNICKENGLKGKREIEWSYDFPEIGEIKIKTLDGKTMPFSEYTKNMGLNKVLR